MTRSLMCMLAVAVALMPVMAFAQGTGPGATPAATPAVTPAATPAAAPEATPAAAPTGTPAATPAATPPTNLTPLAPVKDTPGATPGAAVTGTSTTSPSTAKPSPSGPCGLLGSDPTYFIVIMVGILLMYVWMGRSRRKQEKARKSLLSSLKKGDKITTIGGIIGTVIEVRENEVTVKTDESNNVRMKFARWAIRDVGETGKAGPQDQGQAPEKK